LVSFLQSEQSHSSVPPVVVVVGDLSRGFAPGMFLGIAGDAVDIRLYALLEGLVNPGVDDRLYASLRDTDSGAGVVDFNGGESLFGVFVDE
jgi:hypothetical protein